MEHSIRVGRETRGMLQRKHMEGKRSSRIQNIAILPHGVLKKLREGALFETSL